MTSRTIPHQQQKEVFTLLHALPLAAGLSEGELGSLSEYLTSATYPKGKVVFEQGGRRDALLLIKEGRLSIYKELGDAPEVFAVLHPGNFCCEEALTDQRSVHSKSGQALDELKTLELTYTAFRALSSEHPRLALFLLEKLLQSVAERLHRTDNRLITLYHTGRIISITLPVEEMGRQILAALHEVIRAKRSLFVSFLPSLNRIQLLAHHGFAIPPFGGEDHIPLTGDPVLGLIAANSATILVTRDNPLPHTVDVAYASPSMVGVPITEEGKTIGAILMLDKQNDEFNLNNVMLLEIVARQIAGAIEEGEALHRHQAEEELKRVYIKPL